MCVIKLENDLYTCLDNVSGFGWKVINRTKTGGLYPKVAQGKYHEYSQRRL